MDSTDPDSTPDTPTLVVTGIGKTYAEPVLDDVSLALYPGEALALTGENGAGKSTLSKIVAGLVAPTTGAMRLAGAEYAPHSRAHAEALGVRMVMQELNLVPTLTVAENLFLDRLPHRFGVIDRRRLAADARAAMARVGLDSLDPDTLVGSLGIGHQQMVEIARSLAGDCRVLILDEPTAMLTAREVELLFDQIARLKADGVALVYISHRLEELARAAAPGETLLRRSRTARSRCGPDRRGTARADRPRPAGTRRSRDRRASRARPRSESARPESRRPRPDAGGARGRAHGTSSRAARRGAPSRAAPRRRT